MANRINKIIHIMRIKSSKGKGGQFGLFCLQLFCYTQSDYKNCGQRGYAHCGFTVAALRHIADKPVGIAVSGRKWRNI